MAQTHHFPAVAAGAVSAGLVLALSLGAPTAGLAATTEELQAQLDSASAQLESLYSAAEQAHYDLDSVTSDLNSTNDQIAQVESDIDTQTQQLQEVQGELSDIVASQYKAGTSNLLSIVLGSESFDDFVTRITYANKVSAQQQEVIGEARSIKASLEQKQGELQEQQAQQQQLVSEQQQKKDSADAAALSAQDYYNGLSDELKAKMEEERAAAAAEAQRQAEQAAAEAQKRAEEEAANNAGSAETDGSQSADTGSANTGSSAGSDESSNSNGGSSSQGGSSNGGSNSSNPSGGSSSKPSGGSSGGSLAPTSSVSAMVNRAYQAYGANYRYSGYIWTGNPSTSYFTCSGLIDFALGLPTNSNWPESLIGKVSNYTTDPSQLRYGDLVFFRYAGRSPGHVGIYVGNGTMIDSAFDGVKERSIYKSSFMGGGSIL